MKQSKIFTLAFFILSIMIISQSCNNEDEVTLMDAPVASFTAVPTTVEVGETVTFTDQSENTPVSWRWDFGDGNTSSDQSPSHVYQIAGSYTIELTVTNEGGSDTKTETITVTAPGEGPGEEIVLSTNITEDVTWLAKNTYIMDGSIVVESGATLTIEPGTIIKAEDAFSNPSSLIIARGAKILAEGNAQNPIIFTSVKDDIVKGEVASPNLGDNRFSEWGGLIILGNAPISAAANEVQFNGIEGTNGLYGGDNANDNSGILKYVSIRHTGIGWNSSTLAGLTLAGVGSETTINHIEIVASENGIEWMGGKVGVSDLLIFNAQEGALVTRQAWEGSTFNFLVLSPLGNCFDLNGPEGSTLLEAQHAFSSGTVVAVSFDENGDEERDSESLMRIEEDAGAILTNVLFESVQIGQVISGADAARVSFNGVSINVNPGSTLADYFTEGTTIPAGISTKTENSIKASVSVFDNWTWAAVSGKTLGL